MITLSLIRVPLLWVALLYTKSTRVRIILLAVGATVYAIEFVYVLVQQQVYVDVMRASKNVPKFTAANTTLYILAHFSVVNFLLDIPGAGIPTLSASHYVILAANIAAGAIVYTGYTFVDPYERAWQCYPAANRSLPELNRGMCPQWTDFFNPKSTANSGENNLICRDQSFTDVQTLACTTHVIDTSLPVYWHIAVFILCTTYVLIILFVFLNAAQQRCPFVYILRQGVAVEIVGLH